MSKSGKKFGFWVGIFWGIIFIGFLVAQHSCFERGGYNVLLITLDTTRADYLRCYGYWNVETPALNRLAREGVLFERAYTPVPLTLPAHTSILSSTFPIYHGIADNGAYRVPDELLLLSELLQENGYTTAGFISAAVLKSVFNINQGFDYWDEEGLTAQEELTPLMAERKANQVTDAVLGWLGKNYKKRWFIWAHYYDPHKEYAPPDPYRQLYYHDPYAGEIAFMDSEIKRLFEWMDKRKLFAKTIIIAVGDHGESLDEHNESTHGVFIYEATQRAPFLVWAPGIKNPGRKLSRVVSLVDVMPTILDLLSIPIPKQAQGQSLAKLILDKEPDQATGEVFMESHFGFLHYAWSPLFGLVNSQYKFIQAPKPEIYDLSQDPKELENIAEQFPKLVKQFNYQVEEYKNKYISELAQKATQGVELEPQVKKQLMALGYIPGKTRIDAEKAKQKDPKDYADLLPLLNQMALDRPKGRYEEMLEYAELVLARDPENLAGIKFKGDALFGMGKNQEAIKWLQYSLKVLGDNEEIYSRLGISYLRLEQLNEAKPAFEKAIELEPQDLLSRYYLARIYLQQGDEENALKLIEYGEMRENVLGHLVMASYYLVKDRPGRAEAEFELGIEKAPKFALAKVEYAQYLLRTGRARKALELFEEAEVLDFSLKADAKVQALKKLAKEMAEKGT